MHKVLDENGDEVTNFGVDPEALAFGRGLAVSDRDDGGVRIKNTGAGAVESFDELPNVDVTALWQGPIADRPSATEAPDGARYEATDQELIYRNDADNGWVMTGHGTASDPVPEGHYESFNTDHATITGTEEKTISIPSDVATLAAALDLAAGLYRHRTSRVVINIESGHTVTTTYRSDEMDLRHVRIESVDNPVNVDVTGDFLQFERSVTPRIRTKFDMGNSGGDGFKINTGSVFIASSSPNVGVINAGDADLRIENGSIGTAYRNDYSGATKEGVVCAKSSALSLGRDTGDGPADVSGAGENGIYCSRHSLSGRKISTRAMSGQTPF